MIFQKRQALNRFDKLLYLFIAFITGMITIRIYHTESLLHLYLLWNIFLAWIPYHLSNRFVKLNLQKRWKQYIVFSSWLLFFPNALYLITDLIHINESSLAPEWYDALLLFSAAFVGIIMAYISLKRMHYFLKFKFTPKIVDLVLPLIIFIASFGVYLGRFQRWNSWDVIQSPLLLMKDIFFTIVRPDKHLHAWGFTIIFSVAIMIMFYFLNAVNDQEKKERQNDINL